MSDLKDNLKDDLIKSNCAVRVLLIEADFNACKWVCKWV